MSMTQKEAMAETTRQLGNARDTLKTSKNKAVLTATANKIDYLTAVQAALRGPTREMVERMRGCSDCQRKTCVSCRRFGWVPQRCVDCNDQDKWSPWNFCPVCGKPLTDEAVEMVMRRLEALHENP